MKQTPELDNIQAKMMPGVLTLKGFLGDDRRKLAEIILADQQELSRRGVTAVSLGARLRDLTSRGTDLMEGEVLLDQRYRLRVIDFRGGIPCPWSDGLFAKDDTEMTDTVTGKLFRWNSLTIHLVEAHGFFMGRGSDYRLDPGDLIDILGLEQHEAPDDPRVAAICSRRSIRGFVPRPLPDTYVRKLLEAAMSAPSAGNQRLWHFVVVRAPEAFERLSDLLGQPAAGTNSGTAILVCGDQRLEKVPGSWVQDCSAAIQNILLAAHFLGLGAVWVGVYPDQPKIDGLQQMFRLPREVMPLALIPVGYAAEVADQETRLLPDRIHFGAWETRPAPKDG